MICPENSQSSGNAFQGSWLRKLQRTSTLRAESNTRTSSGVRLEDTFNVLGEGHVQVEGMRQDRGV